MATNNVDDPWEWGVDRVVQELCTSNRSWRLTSRFMTMPDPVLLESALRTHEVAGFTLLGYTEERHMKEDFGVMLLNRRAYLRCAIDQLRQRSPLYVEFLRENPPRSVSIADFHEYAREFQRDFGSRTSASIASRLPAPASASNPNPQMLHNTASLKAANPNGSAANDEFLASTETEPKRRKLDVVDPTGDSAPRFASAFGDQGIGSSLLLQNAPEDVSHLVLDEDDTLIASPGAASESAASTNKSNSELQSTDDIPMVPTKPQAMTDAAMQANGDTSELQGEVSSQDTEPQVITDAGVQANDEHSGLQHGKISRESEISFDNVEQHDDQCLEVQNPSESAIDGVVPDDDGSSSLHLGNNEATPIEKPKRRLQASMLTLVTNEINRSVDRSVPTEGDRFNDKAPELYRGDAINWHLAHHTEPTDAAIEERLEHQRADAMLTAKHKGAIERLEAVGKTATDAAIEELLLRDRAADEQRFRRGLAADHRHQTLLSTPGYLGEHKLPVNRIFYDGIRLGEDIQEDPERDYSKIFTNCAPAGRRRHVERMMRRYLMGNQQPVVIQRGEEYFTAVRPYPASMTSSSISQTLSFSLYYSTLNGEQGRREKMSAWPELPDEDRVIKGVKLRRMRLMPRLTTLDQVGIAPDLDYDDLASRWTKKYEINDPILPGFGESGSEGGYDTETRKEFEKEERDRTNRVVQLRNRYLPLEEVNKAIDEALVKLANLWTETRLPKLARKAWQIWIKSRKHKDKREQISAAHNEIGNIDERLAKMRNGIADVPWSSYSEVFRKAQILETLVFNREDLLWQANLLEEKRCPARPAKLPPVVRSAAVLGNEDWVKGPLADEESDHVSLDGFIISDDVVHDDDVPTFEQDQFDTQPADGEDDSDDSEDEIAEPPNVVSSRYTTDKLPTKPDDQMSADSQHAMSLTPGQTFLTPIKKKDTVSVADSDTFRGNWIDLTADSPQSSGAVDLITPEKNRATKPIKLKFSKSVVNLSDSSDAAPVIDKPQLPAAPETPESDDDDDEDPTLRRRTRDPTTTTEDDIPEDGSPRLKRRKPVREDAHARDLRERDRQRLLEQENRRKELKATLANSDRAGDRSKIIINDAATAGQGHVYIHEDNAHQIKPHQVEGIQFMWNQIITPGDDEFMQGCLLAHTMGLGKTMQVINLLVAIADAASSPDPTISSQIPVALRKSCTLVLCPPTLVDNWMDELLLWAPEGSLGDFWKLNSCKAHERVQCITEWAEDGGILIVGYDIFRMLIDNKGTKARAPPYDDKEHATIKKGLLEAPNIIVADEAHKLKNADSGIGKAVTLFRSKSRIALTGSPLANNVGEYHTMIEFVAPNYLGPAAEFRAKYQEPIEAGLWNDSNSAERRKSLKMLGVLKSDLAPKVHRADISVLKNDLPPKKEFVITVPLTDIQHKAYTIYVRSVMAGDFALTKDGDVTQTTLWAWLAVLSLLCNHPRCFESKIREREKDGAATGRVQQGGSANRNADIETQISNPSASKGGISKALARAITELFDKEITDLQSVELSYKVSVLCQILDAANIVGDKTLVFSQSIPTLDFLEDLFNKQGRAFVRLDGKTKMAKRQGLVKDFNSGHKDIYLISTTAGGLGLNLQSANRVVIFDFRYNPIHEEQSVGRAYRIGQTKPTFVYRFVCGGTFEENVHNKTVFKSQLASRVVDKKKPVAQAKRKSQDFLHEPKEVPQMDLMQFEGMDPGVLDTILESQKQNPVIRSIVQTDTFEMDDGDKLTAEEEKEVLQLLTDTRLWRHDPVKYNELMAKRAQREQREVEKARQQHIRAQAQAQLQRANQTMPQSRIPTSPSQQAGVQGSRVSKQTPVPAPGSRSMATSSVSGPDMAVPGPSAPTPAHAPNVEAVTYVPADDRGPLESPYSRTGTGPGWGEPVLGANTRVLPESVSLPESGPECLVKPVTGVGLADSVASAKSTTRDTPTTPSASPVRKVTHAKGTSSAASPTQSTSFAARVQDVARTNGSLTAKSPSQRAPTTTSTPTVPSRHVSRANGTSTSIPSAPHTPPAAPARDVAGRKTMERRPLVAGVESSGSTSSAKDDDKVNARLKKIALEIKSILGKRISNRDELSASVKMATTMLQSDSRAVRELIDEKVSTEAFIDGFLRGLPSSVPRGPRTTNHGESAMFAAMNRQPPRRPVQSLRTPVTTSRQGSFRNPYATADTRAIQRVKDNGRAQGQNDLPSPVRPDRPNPKIPNWAENQIGDAKRQHSRASSTINSSASGS